MGGSEETRSIVYLDYWGSSRSDLTTPCSAASEKVSERSRLFCHPRDCKTMLLGKRRFPAKVEAARLTFDRSPASDRPQVFTRVWVSDLVGVRMDIPIITNRPYMPCEVSIGLHEILLNGFCMLNRKSGLIAKHENFVLLKTFLCCVMFQKSE